MLRGAASGLSPIGNDVCDPQPVWLPPCPQLKGTRVGHPQFRSFLSSLRERMGHPALRSAGSACVNRNLQSSCARLLSTEPCCLSAPSVPGGMEPTRLSNQPTLLHCRSPLSVCASSASITWERTASRPETGLLIPSVHANERGTWSRFGVQWWS